MAPQLSLPADARRAINDHDRRWRIHFGIRAIAALFSFIGLIIFAVTVKQSKDAYGGNDWADGFPIAPVSRRSFPWAVAIEFWPPLRPYPNPPSNHALHEADY